MLNLHLTTRSVLILCFLFIALGLVGCGEPYALRGKVIQGDYSAVMVVPADDPRFDGRGIAGVRLHMQQDPGRPNRETITEAISNEDGSFELIVDRFGAGWAEIDVGVYVRRREYAPAYTSFNLPKESYRLLVVLSPGQDRDLGERRNLTAGFEDELLR